MEINITEKASDFIEQNIDNLYKVFDKCKDILPESILGMKKEFLLESPELFLEVCSFLENAGPKNLEDFLISGRMTRFMIIIVTEDMEFQRSES
jgi:hypothetical protein